MIPTTSPMYAFALSASLFLIASAPKIVAGIPKTKPMPQQNKGIPAIEHQKDVPA